MKYIIGFVLCLSLAVNFFLIIGLHKYIFYIQSENGQEQSLVVAYSFKDPEYIPRNDSTAYNTARAGSIEKNEKGAWSIKYELWVVLDSGQTFMVKKCSPYR